MRYVPEWSDIYAAIATYIDEMFSERNKLIDNKNWTSARPNPWLIIERQTLTNPGPCHGVVAALCWTSDTGLMIDDIEYCIYVTQWRNISWFLMYLYFYFLCARQERR